MSIKPQINRQLSFARSLASGINGLLRGSVRHYRTEPWSLPYCEEDGILEPLNLKKSSEVNQ
jgi:hypothetical protein